MTWPEVATFAMLLAPTFVTGFFAGIVATVAVTERGR